MDVNDSRAGISAAMTPGPCVGSRPAAGAQGGRPPALIAPDPSAVVAVRLGVGIAVTNLCNLMNPERVIIGGDLSQAGEVALEPLRRVMRRSAIRSAGDTTRIVAGVLGERAEVLGALALVLRDSDRFVSSQLRLAAGGR